MADDRTTIIEVPSRSGGAAGWVIAILLAIALVVGAVLYTRMQESNAARDNAVADAAGEVGKAAGKVGDAARNAVNRSK